MAIQEVNQKEFAALVGLSARQVRNLEDEGLPHEAEGNRKSYPLPEAVQWYIQRKREEVVREFEKADYKQAKARREMARARMAEIDLAKEEGRLISKEVVDQTYGEAMDQVRAALMNMPGRWGAQLGFDEPRKGEEILKRIARETLDHLSGPAADRVAVGGSSTEIPHDFPGRGPLLEAGIETFSDLLALEELEEVHGIGPVTASEIREELEKVGYAA